MKHIRMKLWMSVSGVLLGVVMIMSASYAWFTISTTPELKRIEISVTPSGKEVPFELSLDYADVEYKQDEATWTTVLHLTDEDVNYKLKPVSTVDGINWYLPKFSAKGDVTGFWQLPNNEMAKWANKSGTDDNYLYYVDVYVRTRNQDKAQEMVLSNPINVTDSEQYFANYVLWDPVWDNENQKWIENDAMASVRVGFQYTTLDAEGNSVNVGPFFIYEPNADMRSDDFTKYLNGVTGANQMADQTYIYNNGNPEKVKSYTSKSTGYYPTYVPKKDGDGYQMVAVHEELGNRLVAQNTSSWKLDSFKTDEKVTSKNIETIGSLCKITQSGSNLNLQQEDALTRKEFTTVSFNSIQKMRIYVWIEGQDVDCWNHIANGNLYVNLEFMGRGN